MAISLSCPVCQAAVTPEVLSPISRLEWTQFCSLQLRCDYNEKGCQEIVALEHLTQHTHQRPYKRASFRGTDDPQLREPKVRSLSGGLLIDAIRAPAIKPLSREEDKALGSLLHRKTTVLGSEVAVPIYTGGRPRHISFMTKASPMQSEPSQRTLRRRHQMVRQLEEAMSGNALQAQEQRVFGLKQMTKDERHRLLFSAKISHAISQEDTLAMALHFQLSGEQQRKLRLWTKQWHVQLACERQVRCLAAKRLEDIAIGQEAIQTIDQEADDCTVHLKPSPFV